jgi:hypothetical protein
VETENDKVALKQYTTSIDGLAQAPEAFARVAASAEQAAKAFKRLARAAGDVSVKCHLHFEPAGNRVVVILPEMLN